MIDLVTLSFVKTILRISDTSSDTLLSTIITPASQAVRHYCRRAFTVDRYVELYDASTQGYLMLRQTPVVQLNNVTLYPLQSQPISYQPSNFDVRPHLGRLAFNPAVQGAFFTQYSAAMTFPMRGHSVTQVDYYAGYGFVTSSVSAIAPGNATINPASMIGYTNQQPWSIAVGAILTLDPGNAAEEAVTVLTVAGDTFTAVIANAHSAGCAIAGSVVPADVQLAAAMVVANAYNQPDLTKQRESMGRTVGYDYITRTGNAWITPEVAWLLGRYREPIT